MRPFLYPNSAFLSSTPPSQLNKLKKKLQIQADRYYIPKQGLSSKFPRLVLQASYQYGGSNQKTIQMTQIYKQIQMLLGYTRYYNDTGTMIYHSTNVTKLEAGIATPVLSTETMHDFLHCITRIWIHSIKESLLLIEGTINLPMFWIPKLQRIGNSTIMTEILKLYPIYYTNKKRIWKKSKSNIELVQVLNYCRMYLHVITIADMTNIEGTKISHLYLKDLKDPNSNHQSNQNR